MKLQNIYNFSNSAQIKKINFSSLNTLKINLNKNFKLEKYEVKSSLNLKELVFKNILDLSYFFQNLKKI